MRPIRKLLLQELLLLVGVFAAVSAAVVWFGVHHVLREQVAARASDNLARLKGDLQEELQIIERVGRTTARWWAEGRLDPKNAADATALLRPFMVERPELANLVLITDEGWGISCLREAGGYSIYQLDARQPKALKQYHVRNGNPAASLVWEPTPYRVFERPWYLAARSQKTAQWVDTYRFVNTGTHGITFTVPLIDAQGIFRGAVCADIFLRSLGNRTWAARPTPHSQVVVVDDQNRALVVPGSPDASAYFLRAVSTDFLPLFQKLLGTWAAGARSEAPFRVRRDGSYTCLVAPVEGLRPMKWRICLAVPDADYHASGRWIPVVLLGLAALMMGLGVLRARRLAQRFAAPLERLARAAEELGSPPPAPVPSDIQEIASLGEALHRAGVALQDELELQMQLQHSQRLETLGTLAGGIAHDVNNQLAAIVGQLNLGREFISPEHPSAKRMLKAEEAAQRCAQMIKSLLGFSHQSSAQLQPLDLNHLVRHTANLLERLLGGRIRLDLDLAENLPAVLGDSVGLEQVVMNLAVNARDAMPNGGKLLIATRQNKDGSVRLSVQDTGSGIPAEIRTRIFDPFFTTKEVGKGTGLGLAMVFGIVQAHQGRIEVESEVGTGTEFILTLGAAQPAAASPAPQDAPISEEFSFAGCRILVVEDEPPLRELMADGLISRRAQVDTAKDGEEGWALWQGSRYDLVISDQRMPGLLGTELLARIRQSGSSVPVILVSGHGLEGVEADPAQDPNLRLLAKPFSFKHLFRIAQELLG